MNRRFRQPRLCLGSTAAASFLTGLLALSSVAAAAPEWWNIVEKQQDATRSTTSGIGALTPAAPLHASPQAKRLHAKGMVAELVRRSEPDLIANTPAAQKTAAKQTGEKAIIPTAQSVQDATAETAISSRKHRKRHLKIARLGAIQLPQRNPRRIRAPRQAGKALKLATVAAVRTVPTLATATQLQPQNATSKQGEANSNKAASTAEKSRPLPIKIEPTLKINVDLSAQRMHVYSDGRLKHSWKISSGLMRWRTPNGKYKPTWMSRMHYSKQWGGAPMPHSIFFHRGYAIHGTNAVAALGRPASHGCVRLSPHNARTLFRMVNRHSKAATKITVVGKTPVYKPRRSKTRVVKRKIKSGKRARRQLRKRRNQRVAYAAPRRAKARPRKKVRRYRTRKEVFWPF